MRLRIVLGAVSAVNIFPRAAAVEEGGLHDLNYYTTNKDISNIQEGETKIPAQNPTRSPKFAHVESHLIQERILYSNQSNTSATRYNDNGITPLNPVLPRRFNYSMHHNYSDNNSTNYQNQPNATVQKKNQEQSSSLNESIYYNENQGGSNAFMYGSSNDTKTNSSNVVTSSGLDAYTGSEGFAEETDNADDSFADGGSQEITNDQDVSQSNVDVDCGNVTSDYVNGINVGSDENESLEGRADNRNYSLSDDDAIDSIGGGSFKEDEENWTHRGSLDWWPFVLISAVVALGLSTMMIRRKMMPHASRKTAEIVISLWGMVKKRRGRQGPPKILRSIMSCIRKPRKDATEVEVMPTIKEDESVNGCAADEMEAGDSCAYVDYAPNKENIATDSAAVDENTQASVELGRDACTTRGGSSPLLVAPSTGGDSKHHRASGPMTQSLADRVAEIIRNAGYPS